MRAADELIGKMDDIKVSGNNGTASRQEGNTPSDEEEEPRVMRMVCDETSCVIVPLAASPGKVHGPSGIPTPHPLPPFSS